MQRIAAVVRMLLRVLSSLYELFAQAVFGLPIALRRLMLSPGAAFRFAPRRSVAHIDIARWNEWLDQLFAQDAFRQYEPLTETLHVEEFRCTIRDVEGLGASKSPLEQFTELDDMALKRTDLADEVSIAKLHENLQWRGNRKGPAVDEDDFWRYLWDGRIFWMNNDGSHHFVAARYLAGKLGVRVDLKPRPLTTYAFIEPNLRALLADWEIFVVDKAFYGGHVHYAFIEPLARLVISGYEPPDDPPAVGECLKASRTPFLWCSMRHANWHASWASEAMAIFRPRDSNRARRAADVFRESGTFDLGAHLSELCGRQQALREQGPSLPKVRAVDDAGCNFDGSATERMS